MQIAGPAGLPPLPHGAVRLRTRRQLRCRHVREGSSSVTRPVGPGPLLFFPILHDGLRVAVQRSPDSRDDAFFLGICHTAGGRASHVHEAGVPAIAKDGIPVVALIRRVGRPRAGDPARDRPVIAVPGGGLNVARFSILLRAGGDCHVDRCVRVDFQPIALMRGAVAWSDDVCLRKGVAGNKHGGRQTQDAQYS